MTIVGKAAVRRAGAVGAVATVALLAACSSSHHTTAHHSASSQSPSATSPPSVPATPSGPVTRIASYPLRVGAYRLVDKNNRPVANASRNTKFMQNFPFATTSRAGYYLPGHQPNQDVYLIAGRLDHGVSPSSAIQSYLNAFLGQELHLTPEPAGPLGGNVKCWVAQGAAFCMWADNGTYGVMDYRPSFGADTALIHHLAAVVPKFRQAMERKT